MNRRAFLAAALGAIATPAIACDTFRQLAGFEVEYYGPRQIVIRQGSMSIGVQCNVYSMVKDRVLTAPHGIKRGWHWVWAVGNPAKNTLDFRIVPIFATSTFSRAHGVVLRPTGYCDFRMLPVAVFWEGDCWRPWFMDGGYPQPSAWWTETRESDETAYKLTGHGTLQLVDWVPETGRAFYATVECTGGKARIGTPGHGWIELRPRPGDREIRDVRLLPDSGETIAFRTQAGATIRLWPRGYQSEQPI